MSAYRLCPGVPGTDSCGMPAAEGDRYCDACRDYLDRTHGLDLLAAHDREGLE